MKRFFLFLIIASLFFASAPIRAQEIMRVSEYEVKAAFLFNFAKFVEWPAGATQDTSCCFYIGILGRDPFGPVLDRLIGSKNVKNKKILIRRFNDPCDLEFCHLLFISNSERPNWNAIREKLRGARTLTVGEMEGFTDNRGMIQFVMIDDRVHFLINADAAENAGLKLSSKLLNLAVGVKRKSVKGNGA
jgi:hypothetical protein